MARSQRHRSWISKLKPVQGWPLPSIPEWSAGRSENLDLKVWAWKDEEGLSQSRATNRTGSVRISFPLKFGIGLGIGGVDSGGLVLRLAQVEAGCSVRNDQEHDGLSFGKRRSRQRLSSAANVVDAASLILLSQAFCGPLAALAMGCMAAFGFVQVAGPKILGVWGKQSWLPIILAGQTLPTRVDECATASLFLSIGIPLLKWQQRHIYETSRCIGAGIPVALGYAITTAEVKKLPKGGFRKGEAMWRHRHRWAARRLCSLLSDFQEPSALGWLVELIEQATVIPGTRGFQTSTSLPAVNQQSLLTASVPSHFRRAIKRLTTKQKEPEKEIIISVPPETVPQDSRGGLQVERFQYNGTSDLLVGPLPPEDWALVTVSGSNEFLMDLGVVHVGWRGFHQRASLFLRGCWLALIFIPLILFGPLLFLFSKLMASAWREYLQSTVWVMLRFCLERGGAAFIKWGQWSSTREDLFPESLCLILGRLHDRAPKHSYRETRKAILKHLRRSVEDLFDDFPIEPCASGSIAQVYRAKLKDRGDGTPREVAVKVRHPSVAIRIYQDFQIMSAVADIVQKLPALRWLNLRQSVDQFSHTMTSQADLRVEAMNLQKFYNNFEGLHQTVVWPKLIPDLVSEGVIVETFEKGSALHEFLRKRSSLNTQIAAVGVDTYLKMMLTDNFVHTDLHPGNILARIAENEKGESLDRLQLVLLDCGLAEELPPRVRYHFLSFITNIGAANGERAAYHLLQFSWPNQQRCKRPELLVADMMDLFKHECDLRIRPIDLNSVLKQVTVPYFVTDSHKVKIALQGCSNMDTVTFLVLQLCRKHEVTIDSSYASLVVAVCVLVGFARSLDPDLSIMDAAVPCLFLYNLVGRIPGGIYG